MAKSRPKLKLVKKSVRRLLPHPARMRSASPRPAGRTAHRRTRPPVAVSNGVPLRTLARTQVLASAESLGVTLSKPQLRKAIDRAVKGLKAALAPVPYARPPIDSPAPQEPASTAALGEVASYDRPFSQMVRDEMEGIHPSLGRPLGALEQRGQEHASLGLPMTRGPIESPHTPSPWSSVYSALDETVQRLTTRVVQLANRLGPVLLPPNTPPGDGNAITAPTGTPHVLEGVEMQRSALDRLSTRIVDLTERVVV